MTVHANKSVTAHEVSNTTKTCDAVVKKSKDGKYNVYENKITKVS